MAGESDSGRRSSSPGAPAAPSPSPPTLTLPKGGGAIRGIGEKFAANPVTGTGSMTVPIATSPGRSGFGPQLSLSYDSGAGNGPFGFGWASRCPRSPARPTRACRSIRTPKSRTSSSSPAPKTWCRCLLPDGSRFKDDTTAPGFTIHRYRPRIEGLFARIERWTHQATGEIHWRSISRDNITTFYGKTAKAASPTRPIRARIFSWLICESYDDKGNAVVYEYKAENGDGVDRRAGPRAQPGAACRTANRYLKRIRYGNRASSRR